MSSDTSRFGYQMLTKMGWQSGKGLGAKEDGSTTHVKSVKRRDNLGKNKQTDKGDFLFSLTAEYHVTFPAHFYFFENACEIGIKSNSGWVLCSCSYHSPK